MVSVQLSAPLPGLDYPNALVDSVITTKVNNAGSEHHCALCAMDSRSTDRCAVAKNGTHVIRNARPEPLGKCINPTTGKPVSARRDDEALLPVPGTIKNRAQTATVPGKVNLDLPMTSEDGNGTGTCPECSAHVKLSTKGYITAHNVRKESIPTPPPTVRLAERQTAVADTGAQIGSPDASERGRTAELAGNRVRNWHPPLTLPTNMDTVALQVRKTTGKGTETVRVPATEANVRTAIRQEQRKKQRKSKKTGELIGGPDPVLLAKLSRMLKGMTGLEAVGVIGAEGRAFHVREASVFDAHHAPEGREERRRDNGSVAHIPTSPGPALVNGRGMPAHIPTDKDRTTSKGKPRNAIGWSAPIGRPRLDRVAVEGNTEACQGRDCTLPSCPAIVGGRHGYIQCHIFRHMSKTQRRRYWERVATNKARDERARKQATRPKIHGYGHITGHAPSKASIQQATTT